MDLSVCSRPLTMLSTTLYTLSCKFTCHDLLPNQYNDIHAQWSKMKSSGKTIDPCSTPAHSIIFFTLCPISFSTRLFSLTFYKPIILLLECAASYLQGSIRNIKVGATDHLSSVPPGGPSILNKSRWRRALGIFHHSQISQIWIHGDEILSYQPFSPLGMITW